MPDYTVNELNISNRGLIKLPDDIEKYNNLEKLYCQYNKITSLNNLTNGQIAEHEDKPLGFLPNLRYLECFCNPLKYDFEPTLKNFRIYNASRMLSS